jgi:hypothetical protein
MRVMCKCLLREKVHFFFFFFFFFSKERVFFLLFGERDATTRATKTIQQPKEARARKNKQQETCVPGRARD